MTRNKGEKTREIEGNKEQKRKKKKRERENARERDRERDRELTLPDAGLYARVFISFRCGEVQQRPGTRHEVIVRVLGVDSRLERVPAQLQLRLLQGQLLPGGNLKS